MEKYYYYQDKRIKNCKECPFFKNHYLKIDKDTKILIHTCVPVKEKYGHNEIDENSKPGAWFCRLNNKVTLNCIVDFGKFSGKTFLFVKETAPQYLRWLEKNDIVKIVNKFPDYI